MKTKTSLLTILAIFIALTGFASEKVKMNVITLGSEEALVAFNAETPTNFEVSIKNNLNETVYYYKSKKAVQSYREKFDFSDLNNGKYFLCLNYGNKSLNSELTITKNDIKASPVFKAMEPYFTQNGNKLNVSFLNKAQKPVYINIYKDEQHVTGAKLGRDFCIQKRVNLSNLEKGKYKVVLSDWYGDHSCEVQI